MVVEQENQLVRYSQFTLAVLSPHRDKELAKTEVALLGKLRGQRQEIFLPVLQSIASGFEEHEVKDLLIALEEGAV